MFNRIAATLAQMDQKADGRIVLRHPTLARFIHERLEVSHATTSHPLTAILLTLALVVLVAADSARSIVWISIAAAWFIGMLWMSRSTFYRNKLSLPSRSASILLIGAFLAATGYRCGNAVLKQYSRSKEEERRVEISSFLQALSRWTPDKGEGLYITEANASSAILFLWSLPRSGERFKIGIVHGVSFGQLSFYHQVQEILSEGPWDIDHEMTVVPSNPIGLSVQGPGPDYPGVLLLQRAMTLMGHDAPYGGLTHFRKGELILQLP